jgi:hypothetical protein
MLGPQLHDTAAAAHVQLARTPLQISGGGGGEHAGGAHAKLARTPSSLPIENTFYTEHILARTPSSLPVAPAPAAAVTQERDRDLLSAVVTLIEQKGSVVIDAGGGGGGGGRGGAGGEGGRGGGRTSKRILAKVVLTEAKKMHDRWSLVLKKCSLQCLYVANILGH